MDFIIYKGVTYLTETIEAMREWISDCQWPDLDPDEIDELSPIEVLKGIERNVEGGIAEFITCMM